MAHSGTEGKEDEPDGFRTSDNDWNRAGSGMIGSSAFDDAVRNVGGCQVLDLVYDPGYRTLVRTFLLVEWTCLRS